MIPILYEKDEISFSSNGLGRLRDVISAVVTEERNGIYELDFEYPITGAHFNEIQLGRIVAVEHDATNDVQPFDIVSFERPIDGVVTFHCTHISYRQNYLTVRGSGINSLADAFTLLGNATPSNPFTYEADFVSNGYMAAADGLPRTVRSILGGVEGSILDTYGGEYEWDRFRVILHSDRGVLRDFSIRYGVNMVDYNEELNSEGTYSSCIPYWTDGNKKVIGSKQSKGTTVTGRGECVPMDVSDKFESGPTKAQVEAKGLSMLKKTKPYMPIQNIHVEFLRLQDVGYEDYANLYKCGLCDTINVIIPRYNTSAKFKIVKTVWDVLADRYESMELGDLSMSLSEALGIDNSSSRSGSAYVEPEDYVVDQGVSGDSSYRKWNSGIAECWIRTGQSVAINSSYGSLYQGTWTWNFPITFTAAPTVNCSHFKWGSGASWGTVSAADGTSATLRAIDTSSRAKNSCVISAYAIGKWK